MCVLCVVIYIGGVVVVDCMNGVGIAGIVGVVVAVVGAGDIVDCDVGGNAVGVVVGICIDVCVCAAAGVVVVGDDVYYDGYGIIICVVVC